MPFSGRRCTKPLMSRTGTEAVSSRSSGSAPRKKEAASARRSRPTLSAAAAASSEPKATPNDQSLDADGGRMDAPTSVHSGPGILQSRRDRIVALPGICPTDGVAHGQLAGVPYHFVTAPRDRRLISSVGLGVRLVVGLLGRDGLLNPRVGFVSSAWLRNYEVEDAKRGAGSL
jgi:hypothetical protein